MKLKQIHTGLLFALSALLGACAADQDILTNPTPNKEVQEEKTPIVLSVGGVEGAQETKATRAFTGVITEGSTHTMSAFDKGAYIFMVMKSEYDTGNPDFQGSEKDKYTVCRGNVTAGSQAVSFDSANQKYWDDAHARSSQLSIWAYASMCPNNWYTCTFQIPDPSWTGSDPSKEYKGYDYNTYNAISWTEHESPTDKGTKGAIYPCIVKWNVSNQDASLNPTIQETDLQYQDLLFCNNLADNTGVSKGDGRLKFNWGTRKFPTEVPMYFFHAMSKITIHIKKGNGYGSGESFAFTTGNVSLKGFNTNGTFNIKDGQFQKINNHNDIQQIAPLTATEGDAFTLQALAIPNITNFLSNLPDPYTSSDSFSRFVKGKKNLATDVMMEFTINNNKYQITSGQLFDALHENSNPEGTLVTGANQKTDNGTYIPLEAGKNYHFTFVVGKTKIDHITAQLAAWEEVTAVEQTPSNARIELHVEDRSTHTSEVTSNMDIYRSLDEASSISDVYVGHNWKTKYTTNGKAQWNNTDLVYNTSENCWSTDWFWENNKSYYHIRTLSPTSQVVMQDTDNGDYTVLSSASCASESAYNSIAWGAPFKDVADDYKFTYSTTYGFDGTGAPSAHQIYQAIGPTESPINVLMFHMMSGVHFSITTDDTVADKVQLYDNTEPTKRTTVQLVGYKQGGKVLLGTGLVEATGSASTTADPYGITCQTSSTDEYESQHFYLSAIPQDLEYVQLYITTPDNNQYIVDLKNVTSSSFTNHNMANPYSPDNKINYWYPGFMYNYTFKLKKTGIKDIKATVVDWETITANDDVIIR